MGYLLTKSAAAFTMSAERFFDEYKTVYFWTFTFKDVPYSDEAAMEDWDTLHKRLKRHFPFLKGIRVCELHRYHGIHFHCFINVRIPIRRVFRIIRGSGHLVGHNRYLDFGRMSVVKCDPETIGYLAKYMRKQYTNKHWFGRRRRWGTIGGYEQVRCSDLVYESEATRNRERIFGCAQCSYTALLMVTHFTTMFGHVDLWPAEALALVQAQPLAAGVSYVKHRYENEPF